MKEHPYPLVNNFPAPKTTQPRRDGSRADKAKRNPPQKTIRKSAGAPEKTLAQISSGQTVSKQTNSKQAGTSPDKKYRMTADGTLKEKRSFSKFSKKDRKENDNYKKKNYKNQ